MPSVLMSTGRVPAGGYLDQIPAVPTTPWWGYSGAGAAAWAGSAPGAGSSFEGDEAGARLHQGPRGVRRVGVLVADVAPDRDDAVRRRTVRRQQQSAEAAEPGREGRQQCQEGGARAAQQRRGQQYGDRQAEPGQERLQETAEAAAPVGPQRHGEPADRRPPQRASPAHAPARPTVFRRAPGSSPRP
ncbi:hypothetical protein GCM10010446_02820 [Streptomyces enissocaesilis]|uniref:Uncharacterized protein n=1 Tax=Streptomyces enissocaesilis TaxID=332589 RepID=A0ABP6J5L4_9ACTN